MPQTTAYRDIDDFLQDARSLADHMLQLALLQKQNETLPSNGAQADRLQQIFQQAQQLAPSQQELSKASAALEQQWQQWQARGTASQKANIFLPWLHLCTLFNLDRVDQTILLFGLLQQIEPRYGNVLRALRNTANTANASNAPDAEGVDIGGIALLVGGSAALQPYLLADATLVYWQIVQIVQASTPTSISSTSSASSATLSNLPAASYQLSTTLSAYLQGHAAPLLQLDQALPAISSNVALADQLISPALQQQLTRFVQSCGVESQLAATFVLQLQGQDLPLARSLAAACFAPLQMGCVVLDGRDILQTWLQCQKQRQSFQHQLRILCRDALLCNRILVLQQLHVIKSSEASENLLEELLRCLLESQRYLVVLNGPARAIADLVFGFEKHSCACFTLNIAAPDAAMREKIWQRHANLHGATLDASFLARLVNQYLLTEEAVELVWREVASRQMLQADAATLQELLLDTCREQSRREVLSVAQEVKNTYKLSDIVLAPPTQQALQEVLQYAQQRHQVIEQWGFEQKNPNSKNLCVLFHGPSGTGKTMAASIIANELNLGLYTIDLANVISKYIGETEKQLAQLFDQAEAMNIVLFFDEAESLFSKRTETRDSHDRYANLQTGYLLQRIESYPGIVILSTNLLANIDKAFTRRFKFIIDYPFPGAIQRLQLWRAAFPPATPLCPHLDLPLLAERAALSGGNINNIALAAAFLAASDASPVTQQHLLRATAREYDKLGKVFHGADFVWQDE